MRMFPDIALVTGEGLLLAGAIFNTVRFYKKNKKLKEMASLQKARVREEKLDALLQNQIHLEKEKENNSKNAAYEVAYHEEDKIAYEEEREHISIQIEEYGELSNKKYVVHVFDKIEIGRGDGNQLVLNDISIAKQQLQLFLQQGMLFVRNLDSSVSVVIKRGKRKQRLAQEAIQMQSEDILEFGNTVLKIRVI